MNQPMEMSLEQVLISLAKKQLVIEQLEQHIQDVTKKYNDLLAQNDAVARELPFPFPSPEEMKKLKEG